MPLSLRYTSVVSLFGLLFVLNSCRHYLNELDKFAEKNASDFYQPRERVYTKEYNKIAGQIKKAKKLLKTAVGEEKCELLKLQKQLKKELRKVPCASKTDKVMKYVRYADDFIIGVKGGRTDCESIKSSLRNSLAVL